MARWRLIASHYLKVAGTKWEFSETDRATGKQKRIQFDVPTLLDIEDPNSWNQNIIRNPRGEILGGDIVVAWGDSAHEPNDYIFTGKPTPDMEPIDEEATAASAQFQEAWKRPPETDGTKYGDILIQKFGEKFDKMTSAPAQTEGISEVLAAMTQLMKQNQELMAFLIQGQQLGLRPQIDTAEPLGQVEPTEEEMAEANAQIKRRA